MCTGFTPTPKENFKGGNWSQELQDAFVEAKSALSSAVSLTHLSPSAEVSLVTDASNTHVGAALQQKESGGWRPLAFFSAKLSATQQRYSAFDRTLLGVFLALCHFRFELEGRKFHILTDNLPLVSALSCVSPPWSARQQRQLSNISEFTSDLRCTPGAANVVADNLSHPPPKSPLLHSCLLPLELRCWICLRCLRCLRCHYKKEPSFISLTPSRVSISLKVSDSE